ncbi:hypothetical protein ACRAWF_27805, partial [Streptomyces sp. L7]
MRAMHMFLDSGGVNYLKDFADQLDGIGQSRTKSSMDIMESKWQIIAELVRLLIELLVIAVLSAFTGGSASSQAAVAKARSRVAILTLLDWLMKKTHLMPSLTEAIEEAFTTFAVRLAMMLGAPKGRRPNSFDWTQILQDGAFGAFAGLFHGLLTDLGKGLKNNLKNIFGSHNPFKDVTGNGKKFNQKFDNPDVNTKPNPKPTPTPNPKTTPTPTPHITPTPTPTPTPKPKTFGDKVKHEFAEDAEHFLTEGGARPSPNSPWRPSSASPSTPRHLPGQRPQLDQRTPPRPGRERGGRQVQLQHPAAGEHPGHGEHPERVHHRLRHGHRPLEDRLVVELVHDRRQPDDDIGSRSRQHDVEQRQFVDGQHSATHLHELPAASVHRPRHGSRHGSPRHRHPLRRGEDRRGRPAEQHSARDDEYVRWGRYPAHHRFGNSGAGTDSSAGRHLGHGDSGAFCRTFRSRVGPAPASCRRARALPGPARPRTPAAVRTAPAIRRTR